MSSQKNFICCSNSNDNICDNTIIESYYENKDLCLDESVFESYYEIEDLSMDESSITDSFISELQNLVKSDYSISSDDEKLLVKDLDNFTSTSLFQVTDISDPRLILFFKSKRDLECEEFLKSLQSSWNVSELDTVKIMFYLRDCRGGKGERKLFLWFILWLYYTNYDLFVKIVPYIPLYGCYRDLRNLLLVTKNDQCIIKFWCDQLKEDSERLKTSDNNFISLAAKWVPIQNSEFSSNLNMTHKQFRKFLKPLRSKLNIVEQKMSQNDWNSIDFYNVSSLAIKKYSNSFKKHCPDKFHLFLSSSKNSKFNKYFSDIYPHELVKSVLYPKIKPCNLNPNFCNHYWNNLINCYKYSSLNKTLPIIDVSGSMDGTPLSVAISFGLFLSEIYDQNSPFHKKFINFSTFPELVSIKGNTLEEKVHSISMSNWHMNINIGAIYDLILNTCKNSPTDCPQNILIFSDMQFEDLEPSFQKTNLSQISLKYEKHNLKTPKLIFWNLRPKTIDFSLERSEYLTLIKGFSLDIYSLFLSSKNDLTPQNFVSKILNSSRYNKIKF
jgi:hypothetical protein